MQLLTGRVALTLLACVACGHSSPSEAVPPETFGGPFGPTDPIRLTFDAGVDNFASLSADGRELVYSFQPRDRADRDRCIGFMPVGGGSREEHCDNSGVGATRTDALEYPALNARGDLLYSRYVSGLTDLIPNTAQVTLQLATRRAPLESRTILQLPTIIDGVGLTRVGVTRWADDSTFYMIAEEMTLTRNPLSKSFRDTVYTGNGILRGRVRQDAVRFDVVPGVLDAASFDLSANRDTIFYTRTRDGRLYAVAIGSSVSAVLFAEPESFGEPRELRHPVRLGRHVAMVTQDIDTSQPPAYPAGLAPRAQLKLFETGTGVVTLVQSATASLPAFGGLTAIPGSCRVVVEFRRPQSVSFTTDLYSMCPRQGASCAC